MQIREAGKWVKKGGMGCISKHQRSRRKKNEIKSTLYNTYMQQANINGLSKVKQTRHLSLEYIVDDPSKYQ